MRISCRESYQEQKILPNPLLEQSERANLNPIKSLPIPNQLPLGSWSMAEHLGNNIPSLKLNQQLMNISERQRGQVGRVHLLFMSDGEGKAVGKASQAQLGFGHLLVKISKSSPPEGMVHDRRWRCPSSPALDTWPCTNTHSLVVFPSSKDKEREKLQGSNVGSMPGSPFPTLLCLYANFLEDQPLNPNQPEQ